MSQWHAAAEVVAAVAGAGVVVLAVLLWRARRAHARDITAHVAYAMAETDRQADAQACPRCTAQAALTPDDVPDDPAEMRDTLLAFADIVLSHRADVAAGLYDVDRAVDQLRRPDTEPPISPGRDPS